MTKRSGDKSTYYQLWLRLDKLPRRYQAQVIRDEMKRQGIDDVEAVKRVVEEFIQVRGQEDPPEDQLLGLAAILAPLLGMRPDRFVALSRRERR